MNGRIEWWLVWLRGKNLENFDKKVKLIDNVEFFGVEEKDIGNLNSGRM